MCAGTLYTPASVCTRVCVCVSGVYYCMAHGNYRCRYNKLPLNLLFVGLVFVFVAAVAVAVVVVNVLVVVVVVCVCVFALVVVVCAG